MIGGWVGLVETGPLDNLPVSTSPSEAPFFEHLVRASQNHLVQLFISTHLVRHSSPTFPNSHPPRAGVTSRNADSHPTHLSRQDSTVPSSPSFPLDKAEPGRIRSATCSSSRLQLSSVSHRSLASPTVSVLRLHVQLFTCYLSLFNLIVERSQLKAPRLFQVCLCIDTSR